MHGNAKKQKLETEKRKKHSPLKNNWRRKFSPVRYKKQNHIASVIGNIKPEPQLCASQIMTSRKMPENLSSLIKEEDRECVLCLEIIDIKEVYTSSKCFHVYHEACLKRVGKCSICE